MKQLLSDHRPGLVKSGIQVMTVWKIYHYTMDSRCRLEFSESWNHNAKGEWELLKEP